MEGILWHTFFFALFSLVSCGFALAVVLSSNIVRMAFYLVMSLGASAGLFFLAGADFLGAMQLLIYVGGTLVLLVFGVMLTAQSPFVSMRMASGDWILTCIVSGSLLAVLLPSVVSVPGWNQPDWNTAADVQPPEHAASAGAPFRTVADEANDSPSPPAATVAAPPAQPRTAAKVGMALIGARVDRLDDGTAPRPRLGLSGYLLPFEIVSVHLLVVLVGAAYLARTKRRAGATA